MKKFLTSILLVILSETVAAQNTGPLYTKKDSIKIVTLLNEARHLTATANDILFFAKKFIGVPYGAATLEKSYNERLILNLKLLDCTTYVDVVTSLALCHRKGLTTFKDFCRYLQTIRYGNGQINEYPSRNHYYSSWVQNAENQQLAHEIKPVDRRHAFPFTGIQRLEIHFMSGNSHLYPALVKHPEYIPRIKKTEKELTGQILRYIPKKALNGSKEQLDMIHDGDILAMVTRKSGLDVSHLGFAVWGKDDKLHLLNASSLYKQVVIEPRTLYDYCNSQNMQLGIRVIRINK